MKRYHIVLAAVAGLSLLPCPGRAQQPAGRAAATNAPGQEYPRIHADLSATFRVSAPDAEQVQVRVGGGTYDLSRDTTGFWLVTTPPLVPGFHYYSIVVGGASVSDPNSETFFGSGRVQSGIEVPSPDEAFQQPQDAPVEGGSRQRAGVGSGLGHFARPGGDRQRRGTGRGHACAEQFSPGLQVRRWLLPGCDQHGKREGTTPAGWPAGRRSAFRNVGPAGQ